MTYLQTTISEGVKSFRKLAYEFADSATDRDGNIDPVDSRGFALSFEPVESFLTQFAKDIERATLKDYEEKLWAACDTDEDTDALARILYKASVPQKENE